MLYLILVIKKFLLGLFSFLKQTAKTILVLHDDALQVLQFDLKNGDLTMVAFNELSLIQGTMNKGEIISMDDFKSVLTELFAQAQPKAIRTKKLYMNIPYHLLYTFVEDFSHKASESSLKESILATVGGHCPISIDDLILDFAMTEKEHKISYAAYAFPKKWQQRLIKVCKELGIDSIEFIPEPISHLALNEVSVLEDAALFSSHKEKIYLSLFRNGLLYDSYLLGQFDDNGLMNCDVCLAEFDKAQRAFADQFESEMKSLYFIGFTDENQKNIEKSFKSADNSVIFIDAKHAALSKLIPYEFDKTTLFGIFDVVTPDEDVNSKPKQSKDE